MKPVTRADAMGIVQKDSGHVRNICIMAHVDHGKTTLADSLLASNSLISQRLAGKLRYMDSRQDEQTRGITMKSSAIALLHTLKDDTFLINLIDSPGHVDFSSEVSTAVRLSDGALVLVDVVEGVCAQTIVALRQAWQENLKPVLVLNKMDRLILEMKLTPLDAFVHLTQLLERINVVMAELLTAEVMNKEFEKLRVERDENVNLADEVYDWDAGLDDMDDSNLYFTPDNGNVVFASAVDGWGFRIQDFAKIYSAKIGVKEAVLNRTLWGNFFLNTKLKRIMRGAQEKAKKPLFVQLVLENIWSVYETVVVRKDKTALDKVVSSLQLQIPPRDLKQTDLKAVLAAIMNKWLPLSKAVLDMVCERLPSPLELSEEKVERLMSAPGQKFSALPFESRDLKEAFLKCDKGDGAPVIIFVSKMFAVETASLPENKPKVLTSEEMSARRDQARAALALKQAQAESGSSDNENNSAAGDLESPYTKPSSKPKSEHAFIAFARVFSGTLKRGKKLFVLGPRHDPWKALPKFRDGEEIKVGVTLRDLEPGNFITAVEIDQMYLLMGRDMEALDEVPAGNIIGIGGLEEHVLKTATISSTLACPPFTDLNFMVDPILRVALEPKNTADIAALRQGMKLLNQADPCVRTFVQETGEHVLVTAGEVHLERCLDDLRTRFAKVEITASAPIVPFRETIVQPPKLDMVNEIIEGQRQQQGHCSYPSLDPRRQSGKTVLQRTANQKCSISMEAVPLPTEVIKVLDDYSSFLKLFAKSPDTADLNTLSDLRENLKEAFGSVWNSEIVDRIWAFGPKGYGPNLLLNETKVKGISSVWSKIQQKTQESSCDHCDGLISTFESNFVNGFQLAMLAGPLCEEPLRGVGFVVKDWSMMELVDIAHCSSLPFGPISGQIMSAMKEACRRAFQAQDQRLMVAMYSSKIQVNSEVLGKLYAVVGKRGGRILHGDLQEGSSMFEVTALLPVIESFDFANEVRRQTSGLALPQLVFSHWEVLEIDPFWEPRTEEEYLHFGEKADTENRAKKYMNAVRKRKGLRVEEKLVEFGEKQRTLTKNK